MVLIELEYALADYYSENRQYLERTGLNDFNESLYELQKHSRSVQLAIHILHSEPAIAGNEPREPESLC